MGVGVGGGGSSLAGYFHYARAGTAVLIKDKYVFVPLTRPRRADWQRFSVSSALLVLLILVVLACAARIGGRALEGEAGALLLLNAPLGQTRASRLDEHIWTGAAFPA